MRQHRKDFHLKTGGIWPFSMLRGRIKDKSRPYPAEPDLGRTLFQSTDSLLSARPVRAARVFGQVGEIASPVARNIPPAPRQSLPRAVVAGPLSTAATATIAVGGNPVQAPQQTLLRPVVAGSSSTQATAPIAPPDPGEPLMDFVTRLVAGDRHPDDHRTLFVALAHAMETAGGEPLRASVSDLPKISSTELMLTDFTEPATWVTPELNGIMDLILIQKISVAAPVQTAPSVRKLIGALAQRLDRESPAYQRHFMTHAWNLRHEDLDYLASQESTPRPQLRRMLAELRSGDAAGGDSQRDMFDSLVTIVENRVGLGVQTTPAPDRPFDGDIDEIKLALASWLEGRRGLATALLTPVANRLARQDPNGRETFLRSAWASLNGPPDLLFGDTNEAGPSNTRADESP